MATNNHSDIEVASKSGATELEAGRILFARPFEFIKGCVSVADLPPPDRVEVAFAGRSNVGKSSLINALTGRKNLARTSNTPGRTQELNIFEAQMAAVRIVDMPGFGFARAPKPAVEAWNKLIHAYLQGRPNLRRVYLLIDARHGPKANDLSVMNELDGDAVSYQIVMTKIDKVSARDLEKTLEKTRSVIAKRPASYPQLLLTSSETGQGIADLRAVIASFK